ncbi:hypothetical protein BV898_04249 [Hypsibius exemplaris]|uniref:Secreted protein n=1 Tax=Hypsibius exemplaris TaxID=2072580 RepID=A0A1W0X2U9_HYPEX|nr:hypothetical protein BV898_04249 [Hypsibius exemplaris]
MSSCMMIGLTFLVVISACCFNVEADDTFTCCMAGWKSVRSVVMCPRPCCDGYSLRAATVPSLGPVTYCSKETGGPGGPQSQLASAGAAVAPETPISTYHPKAGAFVRQSAKEKQQRELQQPSPRAQLRLRRVLANQNTAISDNNDQEERSYGEALLTEQHRRLCAALAPAAPDTSE